MVKPGSQGQGLQGYSFSLLWAGTFLSKRKKNQKTIITQHAVTGVHNLLCVKAAAVTTLGRWEKTSLVLDTVFGHDLEKE